MKFDVFKWQEIDASSVYEIQSGKVHVMCSKPAAVFATVEGYEVLLGVGTEIKADIAALSVEIKIQAPSGTRAFVNSPTVALLVDDGEVFTNIDRQPMESGTMLEIKKAMRQFQIEQMNLRRELRAERHALDRAKGVRADETAPDGEPEPASDSTTEGGNGETSAS